MDFEKIVKHLEFVFENQAENEAYNAQIETSLFFGWTGETLSPVSRPAFLRAFGANIVEKAEEAARARIAARAEMYARSHHAQHVAAANRHREEGAPAPCPGAFVWGCTNWMKASGGLPDAISDAVRDERSGNPLRPELVKIANVFCISNIDFEDEGGADKVVEKYECPGGSASDDFEKVDYTNPDQARTVYTVACAVVDPSGRWFLIDSEGYDYARYILLPETWRTQFADAVRAIEKRDAERMEKEERAKVAAFHQREAEYMARAEKWAPLMQPIASAQSALEEARSAESKDYRDPETRKKRKAAERKLSNIRRANILAMIRAAFPGLSVSCRKVEGWGGSYTISWSDGPTEEDFRAATDLDLFTTYEDRFDGYQDMAYTVDKEFCDFARNFSGSNVAQIKLERQISDELRADWEKKILAAVPACNERNSWGYMEHDFTPSEIEAVADALGVSHSTAFSALRGKSSFYPSEVIRRIWLTQNFYKNPEAKPATEPPAEPSDRPASGLQLVEIPGGVAVVGDSRTTYKNRKNIKIHGAHWNKDSQQWQATTPEAVASLREWFAPQEEEQALAAPSGSTQLDAPNTPPIEAAETAGFSLNAERNEIEETVREHVFANHEKFHKLKHDCPERIFLFLCAGFYEAYGRDAPVVAKALNLPEISPICSEAGAYLFRAVRFDANDISKHLPALIRTGNQVAIVD